MHLKMYEKKLLLKKKKLIMIKKVCISYMAYILD